MTGLTHDERGYPVMSPEVQEKCVRRLVDKIRLNAERIISLEESETEGADVIVVSYGITSRVSVKAIEMAGLTALRSVIYGSSLRGLFPKRGFGNWWAGPVHS